jgi:hypothetical protein
MTLARARNAIARGRFNERVQSWTFDALTSQNGRTQTLKHKVHSLGGRFVKLVTLRGVLTGSSAQIRGVELAGLRLRVQLNGAEDLITNDSDSPTGAPPYGFRQVASFATLFGTQDELGSYNGEDCPPFVFASPPRLRTGDTLALTVTSVLNEGEGTPTLRCQVVGTFIDADLYDLLYLDPVLSEGPFNPWSPWDQP